MDGLGARLRGGGAREVQEGILQAVKAQRVGLGAGGRLRILVILDGIDFLLAAKGATVSEMMDMVGEIREV